MAKDVLYAIDIKKVGIISLIGIIVGSILTFIPMDSLLSWIVVMVAIIVIITHGVSLYKRTIENQGSNEKTTNEMLLDVLGIFVGFVLIMFNTLVTIIIASIYLIAEPVIYLVLAKFDKKEMMVELPKIGLGIVLLLGGINSFNMVFMVIGIITLVLSVSYFVVNYYFYKKSGIKIMN